MSIQKIGSMPNNKLQGTFKPKESKRITRSGWYDFDIEKVTYKEETDILVLRGVPSRIGSDGNRIHYDRISVCVSGKYSGSGEADPIEELFDVFELDITQEVPLDYFVGKRVTIYISLAPSNTGGTYYNAEGFEPCDGNGCDDTATV